MAPCVWAGFVLAGSSIPSLGRLPLGEQGSDKVIHFCEYLVLGYLVHRALTGGKALREPSAAISVALCAGWAMADEAHQALVPLRSPEALDLLADVAGSAAGVALRHVRHRTEARFAEREQDGNGP